MIERLKHFNWVSFVSMLGLITIGVLAIWSAGNARAEVVFHGMWKAHLVTAIMGLVVYFMLAFADYRLMVPLSAWPGYVLSVLFLVAVLLVGSTIYGGRRWLWFFQPSEVAKICTIILLAHTYGTREGLLREKSHTFFGFVVACVLVGIPAALILLEPDLGTTLALFPAVLVMMLAARIARRGLVVFLAVATLVATFVLGVVKAAERPDLSEAERTKILSLVPLKPHQLKRVQVFLDPEQDIMGAGYNLRQANISIGSGGARGRGLGKGENHHLRYLPPAISMNDFIFCVWAEEMGFVGSVVLLGLFGVLLVSCGWTALQTQDGCGRLLALGVATLLFAHVFINIAMSIGLVPITGLPLPLISSGRTFLVVVMAGLGLVQSVSIWGRKND